MQPNTLTRRGKKVKFTGSGTGVPDTDPKPTEKQDPAPAPKNHSGSTTLQNAKH